MTIPYNIFQFPACPILSDDLESCIRSKPGMRSNRLFWNRDWPNISERKPTCIYYQDWQKIRAKCTADSQTLKEDKVFSRHNFVCMRCCTEMVGNRGCYVWSIQQAEIFIDTVTQQRSPCCDKPGVSVCVFALISPGLMTENLPLMCSIEGRVWKRGGHLSH